MILPYPVNGNGRRLLLSVLATMLLFFSAPATTQAGDNTGYRSAHFGMTEAAVFDAIEADFAIPASAVERSANVLEKTTNLTVTVTDIVNDTGAVEVIYIFGYRSSTLIQVNLLWRLPRDAEHATQRLMRAARVMANRISLWGIPRQETAPDSVTSDGATLLFQGRGKNGMMAVISMKVPSEEQASERTEIRFWLRVALIENVDAPDIYRIEPGQF